METPFKTPFQEFVYIRTYSRWIEELGRRETWKETVQRYVDYVRSKMGDKLIEKEYKDMYNFIYNLEVMPSMRLLWTAGAAVEVDNICAYNCAFSVTGRIKDFSEMMYITMHGTGEGFSVERRFANNIPVIEEKVEGAKPTTIKFEDSKLGWAQGFEKVLKCLWKGLPFECDYSKIRPAGTRLKTFGGRASGPGPLIELIEFTTNIVENNRGMQLQPIDAYDICCKISEIVVSGGVRRSALISLSDLTDNQIANAKIGEFWIDNNQRQLCNNSVAYTRKPDLISFMNEWKHLYRSKSGERGIFSRIAAVNKANENGRRDGSKIIGTNPCGEVLLRDKSFCNLTEVIVYPHDTYETLRTKVKIATMLGTFQSTLTDFKYIDKAWKENCEEERLLGVSLSGLRDHTILGTVNDTAKKWLSDFKHTSITTNKKYAERFGINQSAAITLIKPSGTVSSLVDCSPGAHVRQTKSGYYIRRVRISSMDPLCQMLRDQGLPMVPETGQTEENCNTYVLEFPAKAPEGTRTREHETAEEQLEYWRMLRSFYCEHNPSITISIKEDEWLDTAAWVYRNFEDVGGLSFLPSVDYIYPLAPYEDITKEEYERRMKDMNNIDFSQLLKYEEGDSTTGAKEFACTGGSCDII